LKFGLSRQT